MTDSESRRLLGEKAKEGVQEEIIEMGANSSSIAQVASEMDL